jgi:DNA repair protein RAD57
MLGSHPTYQHLPPDQRPSFDHVHALTINNIEAQGKVIEYQLPLAVERYNAGLVILDSVAANFRADHESTTAKGLADRAADLTKLGAVLRKVAYVHRVAVVVANQVSDRFADTHLNLSLDHLRPSSPAIPSTQASQTSTTTSILGTERNSKLTLDHQQRFFTGWGDKHPLRLENMKTPALGLAWANQVSARIVLKVENEEFRRRAPASTMKRRRYMRLVFAPWTKSSHCPVEYTIEAQGIVSATEATSNGQHADLMDENLWEEDEEFP